MKKFGELSLGIVTGVGGYLDISSLVTSSQAGALFEYRLMWAVILGGLCAAFLCEQGGRLAAVSGRTVSDAIRERFGFRYHLLLYVILALVTLLILGIEIGGVSVAIEFATGIPFAWWVVPVTLLCWLVLWKGNYAFVQYGVGPSLNGIAVRAERAGHLSNDPDPMIEWIRFPKRVDPGNGMPDLSVTEPDARDMAACLYTLKSQL